MDPSRRTNQLVSEILELLRELSYETQRQDRTINDLRARVTELEASQAKLAAADHQQGVGPGA